jgi:thiosulfate/3-mercaptopyruvate sulfurtransferase
MKRAHFWISIVAIAVMLSGCTFGTNIPDPQPARTLPDYPGNRAQPLLVSANWLTDELSSQTNSLVIIDASPLRVYQGGHIPGAVHAWWEDAMDPNTSMYGTTLKPDENASDPQRLRRNLIEDLGVSPESRVILYDDSDNQYSARLLWTLSFLGYPNAALLDGGLAAWRGAGGAVETGRQSPKPVGNPPVSPQSDRYLWKDQVVERLSDPLLLILDARTDAERADDVEGTIEPGSIPGSVRLPWNSLIEPNSGLLLDPGVLQAAFDQAGVAPDRTILIYSRFGLESSFMWFALTLMDYPSVLIYDGGWAEWAQDPTTPKEHV